MEISNKRLDKQSCEFVKSPNTSGKFESSLPDTIVIHYTAGRSAETSVETLTNPDVSASAHLVIGRDGAVNQLVPFDTIAWHAGESAWGDRTGLNKYSIGIELDNAGRLTKSGNKYAAWFGKTYPEEDVVEAVHRNEKEASYWHRYTEKQITKTFEICRLLINHFDIKTILGHEEIAPERKTDPGPAFPLDKLRDKLLRADRSGQKEDKSTKGFDNPGEVTASKLNIRSGPSTNNQKIANPLQRGTMVDILDESDGWYKVKVNLKGWVSKSFIDSK